MPLEWFGWLLWTNKHNAVEIESVALCHWSWNSGMAQVINCWLYWNCNVKGVHCIQYYMFILIIVILERTWKIVYMNIVLTLICEGSVSQTPSHFSFSNLIHNFKPIRSMNIGSYYSTLMFKFQTEVFQETVGWVEM